MGEWINRGIHNLLAWAIAVVISMPLVTSIAVTLLSWFGLNLGG